MQLIKLESPLDNFPFEKAEKAGSTKLSPRQRGELRSALQQYMADIASIRKPVTPSKLNKELKNIVSDMDALIRKYSYCDSISPAFTKAWLKVLPEMKSGVYHRFQLCLEEIKEAAQKVISETGSKSKGGRTEEKAFNALLENLDSIFKKSGGKKPYRIAFINDVIKSLPADSRPIGFENMNWEAMKKRIIRKNKASTTR